MARQNGQSSIRQSKTNGGLSVLDKHSFVMIFNKDIQKLYIYKKCVRVARALYIIFPAFKDKDILKERLEDIAMSLIDSSVHLSKDSLSALGAKLLTLQTVLTVACDSGRLSRMNGDIILSEIDVLMEEMSVYQEPRITLPETPSLSKLAGQVSQKNPWVERSISSPRPAPKLPSFPKSDDFMSDFMSYGTDDKHDDVFAPTTIKDKPVLNTPKADKPMPASVKASPVSVSPRPVSIAPKSDRSKAILEIISANGPSYIKDISKMFPDVSEKTIQRELSALVQSGALDKKGDRRWTTYSIK